MRGTEDEGLPLRPLLPGIAFAGHPSPQGGGDASPHPSARFSGGASSGPSPCGERVVARVPGEGEFPDASVPKRPHEPLRRTARPPRADAVAQRQAQAARRLFPRGGGSRSRAGAGRDHRRPVDRRGEAGDAARADRRAHGPGAVRLFLRLCRRPCRDRVAGLAGAGRAAALEPSDDARRRGREAAAAPAAPTARRCSPACSTASASRPASP